MSIMDRTERSLRVLVVEDEALIVMDMEDMIESAGHEMVDDVPSLMDLERLPGDLEPDVALVDLNLAQGSSGFDAADHIRATWPRALIVFVTANHAKAVGSIERGDAVVSKPFSHATMVGVLKFLDDGLADPPPSIPAPYGFVAAPMLRERWSMA